MSKKQKKMKVRPTHVIVSSVLNPACYLGSKVNAITNKFINFIFTSSNEEFKKAINIIIRDDHVSSLLNQNSCSIKEAFSKKIFNQNELSDTRRIDLFHAILLSKIETIKLYIDKKQKIEELFIKGDFDDLLHLLDEVNLISGFSIWEMELRFAIYTIRKEYNSINQYLEKIKNESNDVFIKDIARVIAWKSQGVDPDIILETMVRRPNKEFIDGNALTIAAFYSLTCLKYPLYDDVDLAHSMHYMQLLPIIDLFNAIKTITIYGLANGNLNDDVKCCLCNLFTSLNAEIDSPTLQELVNELSTDSSTFKPSLIDDDIISNYSQGNYKYVIDMLEKHLNSINNIITKVNMFAKAYIQLGKEPIGLPVFLDDIIRNLINIYSLKNANQSIAQLVGLIMKYSVLDISDHLMISILKAAPYFFSSKQKNGIIFKSKFFEKKLTPLSYHLSESPSLYKNHSLNLNVEHSIRKQKAILAIINNDQNILDKVKHYYEIALIKKDAIELMVECFIKLNDKNSLIKFAADELISNQNSNICLPLKNIVDYVDKENVYTLDAVICSYYYNKFSSDDNSSIMNTIFEEYIISCNVSRPSELIKESLSKKEVILLNEIAKIDVMDYLGCFQNEKDLKIERIKILNKLVSIGVLTQSNIDSECKMILDDILIENEAAKFNDAKIYIDTRSIFDKRKIDLESLLLQYHSKSKDDEFNDNLQFEIESMAILKGSKNEILNKMITILLVEYFNNKDFGLDKNLSSEIRHGFFGNLICSGPQNRQILTELDKSGQYKSNQYWLDYYKMINGEILNKVDILLINFSENFNHLIEIAEQWMKVSLDNDSSDRVFKFDFTIEEFNTIKNVLNTPADVEEAANCIFDLLNSKLLTCLDKMKSKLNEEFAIQVDDLFSNLIDDIKTVKSTTGMNFLLDEISLANTEVKENIRTVCEWFSLRKKINFESIKLDKLIRLSERCFKQINNCDIKINLESNVNYMIIGEHLYALVFCILNCFNNSFKYASENKSIDVIIDGEENKYFSIKIINEINNNTLDKLQNGIIADLINKLSSMDSHNLLTQEGGSGLYKSLHGLKIVSNNYNIQPMIILGKFCMEIKYES